VAFELPKNSLFAILLRSRWWVSVLAALGMFALVRVFFGAGYAAAAALPFLVIGMYAAFQQLRLPSPKRIAAALERARALPWDGFTAALEDAFRREGYGVTRMDGVADLHLVNQGFVTLVACKRWKAMRTGVEPLREFDAATAERGAHYRIYVATGEVTDTARKYAQEKKIRLIEQEELARLLAGAR